MEDDFDIENEIDYYDYESGPFCRHFSDPSDCEKVCANCGHGCMQHNCDSGDYSCEECDCGCWIERD